MCCILWLASRAQQHPGDRKTARYLEPLRGGFGNDISEHVCLCKHTYASAATRHKSRCKLELHELQFWASVGHLGYSNPSHTRRVSLPDYLHQVCWSCADLYSVTGLRPLLSLPDRRGVRGPQRTAEKPGSQIHNAFPDFPYGSNYHDALYSSSVWGGGVITDIRKWSRSSDSHGYCLWRCRGLVCHWCPLGGCLTRCSLHARHSNANLVPSHCILA